MRFYKIEICPQELYYSNLKLLCETHGLSYRSVDDKIKRQKKPYVKEDMIVTEHHMIKGTHVKRSSLNSKVANAKRKENTRSENNIK